MKRKLEDENTYLRKKLAKLATKQEDYEAKSNSRSSSHNPQWDAKIQELEAALVEMKKENDHLRYIQEKVLT